MTDLVSVPWVLALSVTTGACLSLIGPTQIAFMGSLVRAEGLGNATALFQACLNLTRVIGPFAVAALVSVEALGPAGCFFTVAALFALATVPLAALPPTGGGAASVDSIVESLAIGVRHVRERPALRRLVVAFVAVTLLGFSYFVVLPRFTQNVLDAGPSGYGIMVGVSSIGGLVATVLVAPLADSSRVHLLLRAAAFAFGAALIATGFAPSFAAALVTMVFVGASASAFQALNNAAAFRASDPAYLGRVTAIMNLAWSLTNLVGLPVGFVADAAGERGTLWGVGAGLCALAVLLALWGARGEGGARGQAGAAA